MRKNRIFVIILSLLVVLTLMMSTGCGKTLSGTYSAEALGSGVSMKFSGSRVTLSCKLVGAVVWGEYMPDTFFGMTMTSPWFYSAIYNGSYLLASTVLCLIIGGLLWQPLGKYIRGEDLRV